MDLAAGARRIVVLMQHSTKEGEAKLVRECTYPLTAKRCVHRVITELGVIDCTAAGFELVELAPGVTREQLEKATGAPVGDVKP